MGSSGEKKCPKCGFKYMLWEHGYGETDYDCYACGYQLVEYDDGEESDCYPPTEKGLRLSKIVGPVIEELWKDQDGNIAEIFQIAFQGYARSSWLGENLNKIGVGALVVHIFEGDWA